MIPLAKRRKMMQTNLVGEMTVLDIRGAWKKITKKVMIDSHDDEDRDLIMAVANQLRVKTSEEMDTIKAI